MRSLVLFAASLVGLVTVVGCGGSQPAPAASLSSLRIRPAPPQAMLASISDALGRAGFACVAKGDGVLCDANAQHKPTLVVIYSGSQPRLNFVMPFTLKGPCEDALVAINHWNRQVEFAQASCEKEKFAFLGSLYIPEDGLTVKDVGAYAEWWSRGVTVALRASDLVERLK